MTRRCKDCIVTENKRLREENEKLKDALRGIGKELTKQYLDNIEIIEGAEEWKDIRIHLVSLCLRRIMRW